MAEKITLVDRILKALFTSKGDIPVASAGGQASHVPVGADGTVLTADSTTETGVKWGSPTDVTAAINAAVAALVNGAPGALDTLEELADALGDDANFAATVTTALAGKIP